MPLTTLELIKHRLKNVGPAIAGGMLFGAAIFALILSLVSYEFTQWFAVVSVIAGIIWWIGSTIYRNIKIQRAEEVRRIDAENQRKRWETVEASVVVYPRATKKQVLFDYEKH